MLPFLARPATKLFLTSAAVLFTELLLLRWIPANVVYVGFFSNFLLLGCFCGIGAGVLVGRRFEPRVPLFPLLLAAVVLLVTRAKLDVQVRTDDEIFFGLGAESGSADVNFFVLPGVVVLATLLLLCLAMPLGKLLVAMPPLRAYAIDIAGALAGIAAFTALSAAGTPPRVWFAVLAALLAAVELGGNVGSARPRGRALAGSAIGAAALGLVVTLAGAHAPAADAARERWSAYYRLTFTGGAVPRIDANGIPHQFMVRADKALSPKAPSFYAQIYRWFPDRTFDEVLVVGAGNGTDVAVALARGAAHVDAVEIDRAIAELGRAHHPDRPYASERVDLHIDDGRSWLRRTRAKYDLVVFALPDSLTLLTSAANLRLESFLFTEEAFASVRDRLAPNGVFVLYNFYRQEWLVLRIAGMLERTFGRAPLVRLGEQGALAVFASGPAVDALGGGPPPGDRVDRPPPGDAPDPATDDWPFPYLKTRMLPRHYAVALALVLAFAALVVGAACRATRTPIARASPHFFALGAAFLLLETKSLVTFSLLFGSTWLVNALAFFAILTGVLVAIAVAARLRGKRTKTLYAALFASLGLGFFVPPESLLVDPLVLRWALAGALAFAPIFLANVVFARAFEDTKAADVAFASNMLGAAFGGALEYLSLVLGVRALLVVAAALYALAWLFSTRLRVLGDREHVGS